MFESMNAEQYRALSNEAFQKRFAEVRDLMNADTLPEGVTDEMLFAEAELIKSDMERRSKRDAFAGMTYEAPKAAEVEERNAKAKTAIAGEGAVIDSTHKVEKRKSGFEVVSEGRFTDSVDYRRALAKHILRQAPMPADMIARARQERAVGDPISVTFADGYTNVTDPTFPVFSGQDALVPIPVSVSEQIVKVRKEYGLIHPKVNESHVQGGLVVPVADLTVDYHWINDKQVSPYQYDDVPETVFFTWHELEARFARTMLADALMRDDFKSLLADALAEGYGKAMDEAILNGNGSTQPLGLLNDPRFIDQTANAGTGKALVVEASADDLSDWAWWTKLLFNPAFNRLYRGDGEWLIADSTFGTYIQTLKDEVNRPLVQLNLSSGDNLPSIRGNAITTLPVSLLPDFDAASVGDVIAIFGNLRNYTLNFQPGMPLSTVSWTDHETNTNKTKVLTAVDGKMIDANGWVVIKKKAQG